MSEKNKPSLHDEIMRIPCDAKNSPVGGVNSELAYKAGHRDARHAAAELAAGFESEIDQLRAEVEALWKDAERYRWLIENARVILEEAVGFTSESGKLIYSTIPTQREVDSAIDAAMAAKEGGVMVRQPRKRR